MSWDSSKRVSLHEAGHIIAGYVLSNKTQIADGVGLGKIYNQEIGMTVWEGYTGPTGNGILPTTDAEWVAAIAGFFAGKAAVASAIGRGVLPAAPLNIEREPGDFGFKGGCRSDEALVQQFSARCSNPLLARQLAWSLALIKIGQYFEKIDLLSDWIVLNCSEVSLHMSPSPWTHPVIDCKYVTDWLQREL